MAIDTQVFISLCARRKARYWTVIILSTSWILEAPLAPLLKDTLSEDCLVTSCWSLGLHQRYSSIRPGCSVQKADTLPSKIWSDSSLHAHFPTGLTAASCSDCDRLCSRLDTEQEIHKRALVPVSLWGQMSGFPLQTINDLLLIQHRVFKELIFYLK